MPTSQGHREQGSCGSEAVTLARQVMMVFETLETPLPTAIHNRRMHCGRLRMLDQTLGGDCALQGKPVYTLAASGLSFLRLRLWGMSLLHKVLASGRSLGWDFRPPPLAEY